MEERDRDLLGAVVENARIALVYAAEAGTVWWEDARTVDAIAKRVEEVGELLKRVAPVVLAGIGGVDWKGAKGIRDHLVHDYGHLDLDVLRDVVEAKLPALLVALDVVDGGS